MRIHIRDSIMDMLGTLVEGINYALSGGVNVSEVLYDCRDAAESINIALGESLSQARYPFYQEILLVLSTGLEDLSKALERGQVPDEICDRIESAIQAVAENLENEDEVKIEIAFFPYKASMWDSMESVWLAAKDDTRCNAVVVPIPYYDRLPDGSLGQLYYEGGQLPEYVPIVGYNEYEPSVMMPDIAYIHNPYDEYNYVSSVDSRWYSGELKKYVGTLVYTPYYVNMNATNAELSAAATRGMADIIIAHNERDAKSYMAHGAKKDVIVLGSPKIDRVLRVDSEKPAIPDEWKDKLEGKKVFLLITTVSTVLQFDTYGEKLLKILAYFEGRDDIALIWRPHPLEKSTIAAMRPGQLDGYTRLLRGVSESNFCVLDYTADVEAAIALSDAYIGTGASSVTYMFKITGKPLYIVDFDNIEIFMDEDYEEALHAEYLTGAAPDGNYTWGTCANYNGLARLDTRDGSMEYMGEIPGEYPVKQGLFSSVTRVGDKLILSPLRAEAFVEYDILSGAFRTIPLPDAARVDSDKLAFGGPVAYGDYLIFIPCQSRALARYEKITGEYEYFYDWFVDFEPYITRKDGAFFNGAALVGDSLYMGSVQNNIVCELSMHTLRLKIHKVGPSHYRFHALLPDRRYLWMTRFVDTEQPDWSDSVVRWDYKYGRIKEFAAFPENFKMYTYCYTHLGGLINCGDYILALPLHGNMLVRIDKESGRMTEFDTGLGIDFSERESAIYNKGSFAMACRPNADTLFLTSMYDYSLLRIDLKSGKVEKYKQRFKGSAQVSAATDRQRFVVNHIYYENVLFQPEHFVEAFLKGDIPARNEAQAEYCRSFVENTDGSCGARVHQYVMGAFLKILNREDEDFHENR